MTGIDSSIILGAIRLSGKVLALSSGTYASMKPKNVFPFWLFTYRVPATRIKSQSSTSLQLAPRQTLLVQHLYKAPIIFSLRQDFVLNITSARGRRGVNRGETKV
jgi:hypothetical protein